MSHRSTRSAFAFFLGAAIAAVATVGGCSGDDSSPGVLSAQGESCARTADCKSGLACIDDRCVTPGTSTPGNSAGESDGGTVVVSPTDAGEAPATGLGIKGAEAGLPPRLSALGEACSVTGDCASGLVCIPAASGMGGTCDLASYSLMPTGKTCSGECATAADCCELPPGGVAGNAMIKTCQDILGLLLADNTAQCATAMAGSPLALACFAYTTYCSTCATSNLWSCTSSQCVFTATCQNNGPTIGGCAAQTRTGRPLPQFCDMTMNKCFNNARGVCNTGADCDGKGSADSAGTCRGGDCACFQGGCYFSCASVLDCPQGYGCDTASKLCKPNGECGSDAQCASQTGVVNAKCVTGACKFPCTSDHDCGSSGLVAGGAASFGGKVCGSDGFCDDLGCTTDADCQELNHNMNPGNSTLNYFCATPLASAPPPPVSAITN